METDIRRMDTTMIIITVSLILCRVSILTHLLGHGDGHKDGHHHDDHHHGKLRIFFCVTI